MESKVILKAIGDDPPAATLYYGVNVLDGLSLLGNGSVHMTATSPPYWGLRDYGVPPQSWPEVTFAPVLGLPTITIPPQTVALGLEADPWAFVGHMVAVFREVKRVLRDDGTLWLNFGDSYSGYHGNSQVPDDEAPSNKPGFIENMRKSTVGIGGMKAKDLVGIPWRVAFALQADGWYLRNDIIWAKPNPMPETVKDRCTKSHEYIFLMTKNEKYFYDANAIREYGTACNQNIDGQIGRNKRTIWNVNTQSYQGAHFATWPTDLVMPMIRAGTSQHGCCATCGTPWERRDSHSLQSNCKCPDGSLKRCVVLDPFSGSATTGLVAFTEGRDYIGLDLNESYINMANNRLLGMPPPSSHDGILDPISDMFG